MQLSIIIVNYNVKFYLEQCLYAVQKAVLGIRSEVIVIDNNSGDGSIEYLMPLFPDVQFIVNVENLGFAKANNRGLAVAKGDYVLFLNPDTLVPENSFSSCLDFLEKNPAMGAVGVKMIDGAGSFLPESKRSFPSLSSSFFKLIGLASIFPGSGFFNRYALGNRSISLTQEVDVLAGAFFLVSKKIVDVLHGFDEAFFMYGEDIDLSYRIQELGYQNYYFAGTEIIHFKGESSRNEGLKYVKMFYSAMLVFVQKHYSSGSAKLFSYLIQFAITCRALLTALNQILKPYTLPIIDFLLIVSSFNIASLCWVTWIRNGKDFGFDYLNLAIIFFSILFILFSAITGLYDKKYQSAKTILSVIFSFVGVLALYSLLPESFRFSRGVLFFGGLLGALLVVLLRRSLVKKHSKLFEYAHLQKGKTLIVANEKEFVAIESILKQLLPDEVLYERVAVDTMDTKAICCLQDLEWLEKTIPVSKIIYCIGSLPLSVVIAQVHVFKNRNICLLFHIAGSTSMVGSNTFLAFEKPNKPSIQFRISHIRQQQLKRFVDIGLSVLFLLSAPLQLIVQKNFSGFMRNTIQVLQGKKTWVGYVCTSAKLPVLKKGIITHLGTIPELGKLFIEKADTAYAIHYEWRQDIVIVFKNYTRLGD